MDGLTKTQLMIVIEKNEGQILRKLEEAIKKILTQAGYKDVHYVSFKKVK